MKLLFEKLYPYIIAMIATFLWYKLDIKLPSGDSILSSTLTVSGIFVGFLATSKAILLSMESDIIRDLKDSGYINELVSYIAQAIWLNLAFCVLTVVGYFIDQASQCYSLVWIALVTMSLVSFIRVTDIMLKIFKNS